MIFDPATASTSGASFAALLAAILLAVLGQLALGDSGSNNHKHSVSLGLGLPVLALLLVTTYMFVLLSGLIPAPPHGACTKICEATALLRRSAFLFILCGSALAVSAVAVALIVGLVVSESGIKSKHVRGSVHGTIVGGVVADGIFLIYGYRDIASAFSWHPLTWTLVAGAILAVPVFWTMLRFPRCWLERRISALTRKYWHRVFAVGFTGLVILPVAFFRIWFSHGFAGSVIYGNAIGPFFYTVGCALWAGIALAACIWISQWQIAVEVGPSMAAKMFSRVKLFLRK